MAKLFLRLYLLTVAVAVTALLVGNLLAWMALKRDLDDDYRRLAKGTFHLLIGALQQLPPDAWPERIRSLGPAFGYPLSLAPLAAIELEGSDRASLIAGEIVVKGDGDLFHQRVGASAFAITMGPIGTPWAYHALQLAIVTFLVGGIALALWFWVRPLWRSMVELERAAESFGHGSLSARATVPRRSALAVLALRFNAMADRIERLIGSHKELTRAVAHELRTPIARLRFGVEMSQTAESVERMRYLNDMERDIAELDALIAELLDYARFDRDSPRLDLRTHELAAWLQRAVDAARLQIPEAVNLEYSASTTATATASFDDRLMMRALGNVVRNAIRHARARVNISVASDADVSVIHVDDDGPGVPPAERGRIFEPFVRLDDSRARDAGGYGLGLAIARRVLQRHDGNIELDDSPLGGARFSLRWPNRCASAG